MRSSSLTLAPSCPAASPGRYDREFASILTRDALAFVADLQREFRGAVHYAMEQRQEA